MPNKDMPHFLDQDRPAKVKEIYRALKRDHPEMPAEVKARIAARKGKKTPQSRKPPESGGPKYKAPIDYVKNGEKYVKVAREETRGQLVTKVASIVKEALSPMLYDKVLFSRASQYLRAGTPAAKSINRNTPEIIKANKKLVEHSDKLSDFLGKAYYEGPKETRRAILSAKKDVAEIAGKYISPRKTPLAWKLRNFLQAFNR